MGRLQVRIAALAFGLGSVGLPLATYAEDFNPAAVSVNPKITAVGMARALEHDLGTAARILDLGCEDDDGAQCHTMVGDIRVVALAREESYPVVVVAIQASTPMDEAKLITLMLIVSTVRPDIDKPKIGAAMAELIKKAARLSKKPTVTVDGMMLGIQFTSDNVMLAVSKAEQ